MTGNLLVLIGTWLMSDAIISLALYLNAPGYNGSARQTWRRDHYIRVIRFLCAVVIIVVGFGL